jgi:hypothetical protein
MRMDLFIRVEYMRHINQSGTLTRATTLPYCISKTVGMEVESSAGYLGVALPNPKTTKLVTRLSEKC